MAGFLPTKIKRKDLEDVYDEFSEFSLNSPARKIRRLDADLPPIMEEEEPAVPSVFEQQRLKEQMSDVMPELESEMTDALPSLPLNEERAIVLYKNVDTPLARSLGSNVSFQMSPEFISGLKNQILGQGNPLPVIVEEERMDDKPSVVNNSLAVVPWVASQVSLISEGVGADEGSRRSLVEPMESDEEALEVASMEVEEETEQVSSSGVGGEDFHQWQQHCMTPQLPKNTSTPIMWSWG